MALNNLVSISRSWAKPWHEFRAKLGLPPTDADPLFGGQVSPALNLALFSSVLAEPQPDWPVNTLVTGFPFYDRAGEEPTLSPEIDSFLDAGPPPIVFTLGSSAVQDAGSFYAESIDAAKRLGRRALLLVGRDERNRTAVMPPGMAQFAYAPHSLVYPRSAAVVHQGGIGTTGQALRSGRPMLVVPFGFDQPDNAARCVRIGVARTISRSRYSGAIAAREIGALLTSDAYIAKAVAIGERVRAESGTANACDEIERLMGTR